jgi:hypothetical protein
MHREAVGGQVQPLAESGNRSGVRLVHGHDRTVMKRIYHRNSTDDVTGFRVHAGCPSRKTNPSLLLITAQ